MKSHYIIEVIIIIQFRPLSIFELCMHLFRSIIAHKMLNVRRSVYFSDLSSCKIYNHNDKLFHREIIRIYVTFHRVFVYYLNNYIYMDLFYVSIWVTMKIELHC